MLLRLLHSGVAALALATPVTAQIPDQVARVTLLDGWRDAATGRHMTALRVILAPGWKTYWRAPGDAGIPPVFTWTGSRNFAAAELFWPRPSVFWQSGMRSVGYEDELVLPIAITPKDGDAPIRVSGRVELGVCEDICIPVSFPLDAVLGATGAEDVTIISALADRPMPAETADVGTVTCVVDPIADGMRITASIEMPPIPGPEEAVIEMADPSIWVSDADLTRSGNQMRVTAEMVPPDGAPFMVVRSEVRITILGEDRAVDIQGCSAG